MMGLHVKSDIRMNIKYTKEMLEPLVKESVCVVDVIRKLGLRESGGSHSHLSRKIREYGIDMSHFTGKTASRGRNHCNRRSWKDTLILRDSGKRQHAIYLRRALIDYGREYKCEICGLYPMWNGKELRIQVDHKSHNWLDDRPENLRFVCPNCHTQTEGYNGSKGHADVTGYSRYYKMKKQNGTVAQLAGGTSLRN